MKKKIRIIITSNIMLPVYSLSISEKPTHLGPWITQTIERLSKTGEYIIAVAMRSNNHNIECRIIENITYYNLPRKRFNKFDVQDNAVRKMIDDFKPDIMHIEGTEMPHSYRYLQNWTGPHLVSIQGIMHGIERYNLGFLSFMEILLMVDSKLLVMYLALWANHKINFLSRMKYEKKIFLKSKNLLGRTLWDRAYAEELNPNATYYQCARVLRMPFYNNNWNISDINRNTIIVGHSAIPLKGLHVLLAALGLVKVATPDIKIIITGEWGGSSFKRKFGFQAYIEKLIKINILSNSVQFTGSIDENDMAYLMKSSHLFVLPSLIENESITLAEALSIGTPCISSYCGGIPSLYRDDKDLLFFRAGDHVMLSYQIKRLLRDDDLASYLSENGKKRSREIYDPEKNTILLSSIHKKVILNQTISNK